MASQEEANDMTRNCIVSMTPQQVLILLGPGPCELQQQVIYLFQLSHSPSHNSYSPQHLL